MGLEIKLIEGLLAILGLLLAGGFSYLFKQVSYMKSDMMKVHRETATRKEIREMIEDKQAITLAKLEVLEHVVDKLEKDICHKLDKIIEQNDKK